ncbi:MAG: cyclic di-GMP phosphodiesterase [Actinomycetota bacterium]|jgi:putative two-component system response regulator|nr:cyclic di-GMP phosphodiesterase [Actinomycetota bacterium]
MTPIAPSILVVDDEAAMRDVLVRLLERGGYSNVRSASSCEEALGYLVTESTDLILTDMQMPRGSGIDLLAYVHAHLPQVATIMITGVDDKVLGERALALGAYGYLIKPFRPNEVLINVSNALRRLALELENRGHRQHLEEKVKLRTDDLWKALIGLEASQKATRASRSDTIKRLAIAGEFRDEETGRHVIRMSRYCEILARAAGANDELCDSIREAGSLHDLGKIGIPDRILLKHGPLTREERSVMETHAQIGHRMLSGSQSPLLELAAEIALTHHEKVDGTGYPNGLRGESIPLPGRIAAIADVFDALTTHRVYRRSYALIEVVEMMKKESGTHFDKQLLAVFWDSMAEVLAVKDDYGYEVVAS